MKIAVLGTRYSPPFFRGGEEHIIHELKKNFEQKGHKVDVFTPGFKKWKDIDLRSKAGDTTRIPVHDVRFFYNLEFSYKFHRIMKPGTYDIVLNTHSHLGYFQTGITHVLLVNATSRGEAAAIKDRNPVKVFEKLARSTFGYSADKKVYDICSHIICVNPHIKSELTDYYGVCEDKIDIIGNGVDCDYYSPAEKITGEDEVIITYAGRLVSRKNVDLLIRAVAALGRERFKFRVRIIGEGEEEKRLKGLAGSLGINDSVAFLGRKDKGDLLELYRSSDLFVLPSRYEGMPLVLLESQACGVPAVVTNFDGADKVIENGRNGCILDGWSSEELAECLKTLSKDDEMRKTMSKNAREKMVREYSWEKIGSEFLQLFKKISK